MKEDIAAIEKFLLILAITLREFYGEIWKNPKILS